MTDIDRLYHKIKDHYNLRRCLMNASAEELTFLVELLDEMERDDFGKDTNVPTKWVSVKDRLPTDAGIYIICDHYGNVMSRHFCKSHGKFAGYWHANGSAKYGNPLYWMPLPEPPKEGDSE